MYGLPGVTWLMLNNALTNLIIPPLRVQEIRHDGSQVFKTIADAVRRRQNSTMQETFKALSDKQTPAGQKLMSEAKFLEICKAFDNKVPAESLKRIWLLVDKHDHTGAITVDKFLWIFEEPPRPTAATGSAAAAPTTTVNTPAAEAPLTNLELQVVLGRLHRNLLQGPRAQTGVNTIASAFRVFDSVGSGLLTEKDFASALLSIPGVGCSNHELVSIYQAETKRVGRVLNVNEWIGEWARHASHFHAEEERILKTLAPCDLSLVSVQAILDPNRSGTCSKAAFLEHVDQSVGKYHDNVDQAMRQHTPTWHVDKNLLSHFIDKDSSGQQLSYGPWLDRLAAIRNPPQQVATPVGAPVPQAQPNVASPQNMYGPPLPDTGHSWWQQQQQQAPQPQFGTRVGVGLVWFALVWFGLVWFGWFEV